MANAPEYKKYDHSAAYQQAEEEQRKAQDAAYNSAVSELNAQSDKLSKQYDTARQGVYKNALISAQGAKEVMAARGLASSGASETSNISRQIALQNTLNQANLQEQAQKDDIAQKIIQAGYARDQNMAQYLAQAILNKSNSEAQENQYASSYDFNAWQAQQEADRYATEFAYNKAMNEINTFGKIITQEAANALGLPIGTTSYAVQQAEAAKKKVGSRGGSNSNGENPRPEAEKIVEWYIKNNGFSGGINAMTLEHAKQKFSVEKNNPSRYSDKNYAYTRAQIETALKSIEL